MSLSYPQFNDRCRSVVPTSVIVLYWYCSCRRFASDLLPRGVFSGVIFLALQTMLVRESDGQRVNLNTTYEYYTINCQVILRRSVPQSK